MPYGSFRAQESLEFLLLSSSLEENLSVVFLDDAVIQLKKGQSPADILSQNFTKVLQALSLYEIDQVYVEEESLFRRGLGICDLTREVQVVDTKRLSNILLQQDLILSF